MTTHIDAPAGWYPVDGGQRYWNGSQWTDDFRPVQVATGSPVSRVSGASSTAKRVWYRRGWVIGLAALVIGIGIGGASAGGTPDPKTSQAYKDLASQLKQSEQQAADATAKLETVQGNLPGREAAVKKSEAQVKRDQAAVAARERSVTKRERAVGVVEKTIAANTVSGTGMYKVGVDMKPGTYKTAGSGGCYYAVLNSSDTNDIATNNLTDGPGFVTVATGKYFDTEDCADWVLQQ
jgi:Protein of unknown function (DUF2510)